MQRSQVNLDQMGLTLEAVWARNPTDARTGAPIASMEELRELYGHTSFEDRILLPDRVQAMCEDLFNCLLATGGPEQKTVIFCVRDSHSDAIATELNNRYVLWCQENGERPVPHYAFKCTAASGGQGLLPDLKGSNRDYFIATTAELLSTGVDVPSLRNVVFFKYMESPILFYQMVGRGTRIDASTEKLMFRIYDYTNATRLFGQSFITKLTGRNGSTATGQNPDLDWFDLGEDDQEPPQIITVDGFEVQISAQGRFVLGTVNGQTMPIPVAEYEAQLAEQLQAVVATAGEFRSRWVVREERRELLRELVEGGRSPKVVQLIRDMQAYDLFDVLGQLGYDWDPQSRTLRFATFAQQQMDWLKGMPPKSARTVEAIAQQFVQAGTDGLEDQRLFQIPAVMQAGGLPALKLVGKPLDILQEMKVRLFAA
jgi:type I restriction enzyme, R subunit